MLFVSDSQPYSLEEVAWVGNIREGLANKRADLTRLARLYAAERIASQREYVGQFVDRAACFDEQYGVYGIAAYLSVTLDDSKNDDKIKSFAEKCRLKLSEWVSLTTAQAATQREAEAVEELAEVVPKICAALIALRGTPYAQQALLKRLNNAPHKWGLLIASPSQNAVVTASAVRDILAAGFDFWNEIHEAAEICHFLLVRASEQTKEYAKQLLLLNTLAVLSPTRMDASGLNESDRRKLEPQWISSRIRAVLGRMIEDSRFTPFVLPNPLIEDEVHGSRCRYVRYSTDLVLLEALHHASWNQISFLETGLGRHLARRLITSLSFEPPLTQCRNTCGERLSFSTVAFTDCVLKAIEDDPLGPATPSFIHKIIRYARTSPLSTRIAVALLGAVAGILMSPIHSHQIIGQSRVNMLMLAALVGFGFVFIFSNSIVTFWSRFISSPVAAEAVWDVRVEWKKLGRVLLYGVGIIVLVSLLSAPKGKSWRDLGWILVEHLQWAVPGAIFIGFVGRLLERAISKFFDSHE